MRLRGVVLGLSAIVALGLLLLPGSPAYSQSLGKFLSPGDLSSLHSEAEGLVNCTRCHTLGGELPERLCLECHEGIAARIEENRGYHATLTDKKCFECHSDHKGARFAMISWSERKFDHSDKNTGYPLRGKHAKAKCKDCHKAKSAKGARTFLLKSAECLSCHGDIHKKTLGQKCEDCHNEKSWKGRNVRFDHAKSGYPLEGKHAKVKCIDCHKEKGIFEVQNFATCVACHVKEDTHKGSLGSRCEDCHNEKSWKKLTTRFNHDKTKYPLKGKHNQAKCDDCHKKRKRGIFKVAKFSTCDASGCHDIPKRGFIHKRQFKKRLCDDCHTEKGWKPTLFKHESKKYKGFKLHGKHAETKCEKCHTKGAGKTVIYRPVKSQTCDASGCHNTKARGDIHDKQFKNQKCADCHTENGWKPSLFKHESPQYAGFKLHGKHVDTKCEKCHTGGDGKAVIYRPVESKTCDASGCHDTKARGAIHGKQFKDQKCADCHTESGWKPSLFKHESTEYTGFKLHGKHADTKCEKCHTGGDGKTVIYRPVESQTCDASGCHNTKARGAIHGKQFKDQKCTDCHNEKGWKPSLFKHESTEYEGFKLHGKHADTKCEKCHQNSVWKPLDQKCLDCHTKDDKHKGRFGASCEQCHDEKTWKTETFNHTAIGFKLDGAHKGLRCDDCHQPDKKALGDGEDCAQCHTDPHLNQFGDFCSDCHSAKTWEPTKFRHSHTGFRLEGAHRVTDCESCHQNRVYRNTPVDCYGCHQNSFLGSQTAIHNPSNINCEDCHRAYSWNVVGTRNIHSAMTFSGAHKAIESNCNKCHQPGSAALLYPGATFESDCETCHQADYAQTHANGSPPGVAACPQTCALCHNTTTFFGARDIVQCD